MPLLCLEKYCWIKNFQAQGRYFIWRFYMAMLNEIRGLAEYEAKAVTSSPRDWMKYLDTAAKLYRYSFPDTLLIHAQRPDATACASLELWNEKMNR